MTLISPWLNLNHIVNDDGLLSRYLRRLHNDCCRLLVPEADHVIIVMSAWSQVTNVSGAPTAMPAAPAVDPYDINFCFPVCDLESDRVKLSPFIVKPHTPLIALLGV